MRKSSGFKEKLYKNDAALCIVGDGIRLEGPRVPHRRHTNRTVTLPPLDTPEPNKPEPEKKQTFRLHVTDLQDLQVRDRRLQTVHDTVDVEDFQRILRRLCMDERGKQGVTNDVIAEVNPREVYQHFFGQHYDYLKSLVDD